VCAWGEGGEFRSRGGVPIEASSAGRLFGAFGATIGSWATLWIWFGEVGRHHSTFARNESRTAFSIGRTIAIVYYSVATFTCFFFLCKCSENQYSQHKEKSSELHSTLAGCRAEGSINNKEREGIRCRSSHILALADFGVFFEVVLQKGSFDLLN